MHWRSIRIACARIAGTGKNKKPEQNIYGTDAADIMEIGMNNAIRGNPVMFTGFLYEKRM